MRHTTDGQTVTIFTGKIDWRLTVITEAIIRIQRADQPDHRSTAIEGDKMRPTAFTVAAVARGLALKTSELTVCVTPRGHVDVYAADGTPLVLDYRGPRVPLVRDVDAALARLAAKEGHEMAAGAIADRRAAGDTGGATTEAGAIKDGRDAATAPAAAAASTTAAPAPTHATAPVELIKKMPAAKCFYGLGDKTGFINKYGYEYDNWNTGNSRPQLENFTKLYKSVPILYGLAERHAFGLFFDNAYASHLDLGKESADYYTYSAQGGVLDYYVLGGRSLAAVVANYTYLTGTTPLPQKWTLGYHQSRWSYQTAAQVTAIATQMRAHALPCDAIHLDIDYMAGYRVFTIDQARFPALQDLATALGKTGIKLIPIIDPGVKEEPGYPVYDEGCTQDYFVKTPSGPFTPMKSGPGRRFIPTLAGPRCASGGRTSTSC